MTARPVPIDWRPELPVFASEPFLKTAGSEYGWIGGFDAAGRMRCVLPYTVLKKAIFRVVRFRVATIALGELSMEEERTFLDRALELFRSMGMDMIVPASNNTIFRAYPEGALAAPYGSYVVDLTQPEETLWNKLHSKHRNVIRNAMKKGVEIQSGLEHLGAVYEMVRATLKRSGLGFMERGELERLVAALGPHVKLFIARLEGAIQGCAMIPFSEHSAYYVYGGSAPEPATGAMNLLHWEAMRTFQSLGVRRYDFVGVRINPEKGSKQEGLMMFKQRFGGELVQGWMWKYPFRPLKHRLYSMLMRLKQGGDVVDQERSRAVAGA